jgi:predicted HicB family RNase H-like nuclease
MKKNARLGMRVDSLDKKKWREAAARSNMSLSAWIEHALRRQLWEDTPKVTSNQREQDG